MSIPIYCVRNFVSDKLQNLGQSEVLGLYVTHKFNKNRVKTNI